MPHEELLLYSLQANANMQAAPSAVGRAFLEYKEKKEELENEKKKSVNFYLYSWYLLISLFFFFFLGLIEEYGDGGVVDNIIAKPNETLSYVEYDVTGRPIDDRVEKKKMVKSKWDEDVYNGNHTSIWGSWWSSIFCFFKIMLFLLLLF